MINKTAQKKIKKELKTGDGGYYETIAAYLKKHKIFNAKGKEFSESMIRILLNEPVSHAKLERAVWDCFAEHVILRKKEERRLKALLKTA
jgi:hypothetical protein